ncbi:MAG TPA: phosphatase PAP2 family protein, partial [Gemmatimonadaceae bacterium]
RKGTYLIVGRERPDTSPNDPNRWQVPGDWNDWQEHSFVAGHFANAMSCATYWNERFNLGWWGVPVYALAGAIGVGRLADGGHWTSDTVLGGILGYAVGREVARRSLERYETKNDDDRRAELILTPDRRRTYFGVNVSF